MPELSFAIGSVVCPFSFVAAPVWPCLGAPALLDATLVDVTVVDSLRGGRDHLLDHIQVQVTDHLLQPRHLLLGLCLVRQVVQCWFAARICFAVCLALDLWLRVNIFTAWNKAVLLYLILGHVLWADLSLRLFLLVSWILSLVLWPYSSLRRFLLVS